MPFKNPHPLYSLWQSMRNRCRNPRFHQWADYGGRGIKICARWDSFASFVADMGPRPDGYLLDRIDNDGNYEPCNCRWVDRKTQQRNQRRAVYVIIEGKKHRAIELADRSGHKVDTIVARANSGLSLADVVSSDRHYGTSGLAMGAAVWSKQRRAVTHCKQGHEFTPKNTYFTREGWKRCRLCHAIYVRRWTARN